MSEDQLKKKLIILARKKKKIENEIDKLEKQLVRKYCPKGKHECEPAYCVLRVTGTCPFLKEWHRIMDEVGCESK